MGSSHDRDSSSSVPPPPFNSGFTPSGHQQFDAVDLTNLQTLVDIQRADINRIDAAGCQIVSAFDSSVDRIEREVKKLHDTMLHLRRDLDGNREDISSLKNDIDEMKRDIRSTSTETMRLTATVQELRQSVPSKETVARLEDQLHAATATIADLSQSSLDRAAETANLRRELSLAKTELHRMRDGEKGLKKAIEDVKKASRDSLALTNGNFAREMADLHSEVRLLRQEVNQRPPPQQSSPQNNFSAKELDILTSNIAKIGNRASQIETLQMEFQLFKSRLQRVEASIKTKAAPPESRRTSTNLGALSIFPDDGDEDGSIDSLQNVSTPSSPVPTRRKRNVTAREQLGDHDTTPSKRPAFSSDFSNVDAPDYSTLTEWPTTSPLENGGPSGAAKNGNRTRPQTRSRGRPRKPLASS